MDLYTPVYVEVLMKNRKTIFPIYQIIFLLTVLSLVSCGQPQEAQETPPPVPTATPAATAPPTDPFTEEELRRAILELKDDEQDMAQKQEYYERLLAMDVFGEGDYEELARIYGSRGDWQGQRRMLFKLLRLYPSEEHARMLSEVTVYRDDTEEDMAVLAGQIRGALEQQDAMTLKALTATQEWKRLLQEDLDAIETRTCYQAGEETLQVAAGGPAVEITCRSEQGNLMFYRQESDQIVLGSAILQDGAYAGEVKVSYCDGEGNVIHTIQGTMKNSMCVGPVTIVYQGVEYTGTFSEEGVTVEEQLKEVTEQGGVVYAYGSGGKAYLYQVNAVPADFRIDTAFLGLPEYEEWR